MKLGSLISKLYNGYTQSTSSHLKIVDAYLFYIFSTGIILFVYCCVIGTFPFNSFLSGFISCVGSFVLGGAQKIHRRLRQWRTEFISCVGSFVLGVALRVQSNPRNKLQIPYIGTERAFADFVLANMILHLVVINYIG